jgi:hypothetical protein
MGRRRWLDPPEVIERKRRQRSAGVRSAGGQTEFGIAIPVGCMVPLVLAEAVLVGAGVLIDIARSLRWIRRSASSTTASRARAAGPLDSDRTVALSSVRS